MAKFIPSDIIEKARSIDLLTYLKWYEPSELVKVSGNTYSTREHDSLRINNGKWYWFSRGFGGYSALDYLIKVKGYSFLDAVEILSGQGIPCPTFCTKEPAKSKLLLPARNNNNDIAIRYLEGRGIKRSLIDWCIEKKLIFESKDYHNVIFVGYDELKVPRHASYRATSNKKMLGDAAGSDKKYTFRIENGNVPKLHLFECAIDLLSYMSIIPEERCQKENFLAFAGIYGRKADGSASKLPIALTHFLAKHDGTERIYLHFDNDGPGRSATSSMKEQLEKNYEVINSSPPYGKDYNEYLQIILKQDEERSF